MGVGGGGAASGVKLFVWHTFVFRFQLYVNKLTVYQKLVGKPVTIHCILILS